MWRRPKALGSGRDSLTPYPVLSIDCEVFSMTILTEERVALALRDTGAIIANAAEKLGVSRLALYRFMKKHPAMQNLRLEIENETIDLAEYRVVQAILAGDLKTTRWYLERKGRGRGYVTRQEQTGADGEPLQFQAIERTVITQLRK